jgi:cysteinyl-tRNA synthetase
VVSIWVHGGFLQMKGQKMAKSAGNIRRVVDLAEHGIDPLAYRLLCFGTRYRSEMDFSWEALEGAQSRLTHFRQRMAGWANEPNPDGSGQAGAAAFSEAGLDLDRRFRDAIAEDLDVPAALVVVEELRATTEVSGSEKFALLSSWDQVLGLDLGRLAREGFDVPDEIQALVQERDEARQAKDYARSDAIRDRLTEMGWEAMDTPEGTKVRPKLD